MPMISDARNAKVLAALVLSMTLGAAVLLWLEGPPPRWAPQTLLLAETQLRITDATIEYVPPGEVVALDGYDGVITPGDGSRWEPQSGHVRIAVVGSPGDRLDESQALNLLKILGTLNRRDGLEFARVRLDPNSDPRQRPDLPAQARELSDLLVRKGIIP